MLKRKGNEKKILFRKSQAWINFSRMLRKERPYCELCGCKSKTLQVHHMDEEHYTDISDPKKFMVLCHSCHSYISRYERIKPENRHKYNPIWVEFCARAFV